jgi:hypothetical protein
MSTDFDGTYHVSSTSNYGGPLEKKSDGVTKISDGKTERRDGNNVLWTSTFKIMSDTEVEMVSVADPGEAKPDFALLLPDGRPTRAPVTYRSTLKLARKGDKIQMSGRIEYGNEIVFLTLRRTSA